MQLLTSAQNVRWMNSLGISNAVISARLWSIRLSLEPASFFSNAARELAIPSRIEETDGKAMMIFGVDSKSKEQTLSVKEEIMHVRRPTCPSSSPILVFFSQK